MNCLEFRRIAAVEPGHAEAMYHDHRVECPTCGAFAAAQEAFDQQLRAALNIDAPDGLASRIMLRHRLRRRPSRWFSGARAVLAAAASVIAALGLGTYLWHRSAPEDLGSLIVEAVIKQRDMDKDVYVGAVTEARALLNDIGMDLRTSAVPIERAWPCEVNGNIGVHIILTGKRGPVSVVMLPQQDVAVREEIASGDYQGVIMPAVRGSVAIVGVRGEVLQNVEEEVRHAFYWL